MYARRVVSWSGWAPGRKPDVASGLEYNQGFSEMYLVETPGGRGCAQRKRAQSVAYPELNQSLSRQLGNLGRICLANMIGIRIGYKTEDELLC